MHRYRAFGLIFESDLACPELWPADGPPDVSIRMAPAQATETNGTRPASGFDATPGHFDLRVPRVGRFIVSGGRSISVEPHPAADEDSIRLFLLGTAVGALLHQRELLPLHGSAIHKDGKSLLVVGISGSGKSTLAAALGQRGWRLQSDDVSVVRLENGEAWCEPAFPRRKMWPDMLKQLGEDPGQHPHIRAGVEKRNQLIAPDDFHDAPAPIGGVIVLRTSRAQTPALVTVAGPARMACLKQHTFRANLRDPLAVHLPHFTIIGRLADQVPVWRLLRPRASVSPLALVDTLAPALDAWPSAR